MPAKSSLSLALIVALLAGCSPPPQASSLGEKGVAGPQVLVVCPTQTMAPDCAFSGGSGIQAAVDVASDGDIVQIRAGTYSPKAVRDVPYKIHTIRGFVVVDGKQISLVGEPGAVLDGSMGPRTTGLVLHRSSVEVSGLKFTGFKFEVEEDEIYEGHGIFAIDSRVRLRDVTIEKYQKMALTGRGSTDLDVEDVRILDGHVAIWLDEYAHLRLRNSLIRGNDSAGIAAYTNSTAHVSNCVFDGNLDDALYGEQEATIHATNSIFLNNKPYVARATGNSKIWIGYSGLFGNENGLLAKDAAVARQGANVIEGDLMLDAAYRVSEDSPLFSKGDPAFGIPGLR
ncbi:right-handed parallel beta-helix repeat-containing protein [Steroidobacter sp. S1-65]|uniref:Right-handed parallel beta-helix repeat-containing protein n=1 Tax=Steroidobacter gossypii TaxID=2805490 RepID=A0ABS1WZL9_9GAMM|nr:right-handed parallel beta-helix repeat-containing protein [Steroidobacter gossypii]MBM0106429.1 right-handed parallel beta-helix repeat-containing protein [Steroidobacter gossypii]